LTRKELSTFHPDLDNYLKQHIPHIYKEGILNNQTIGIEDVKTIKRLSRELAEREVELSERKEQVKEEINKVKSLDVAEKNVYDVQKKWTHLTNQFEKTMFGKTVVDTKNLNKLNEFLGGVKKNAELIKSTNYDLEKKVTDLTDQIANHRTQLNTRDNQINRLKRDVADLHHNLAEQQEYADTIFEDKMVLKSLLKDVGKEDLSMSNVEFEGRVILERLENNEQPKDSYECSDWKDTLEANKEKGYIPENRLTKWIQQLGMWLKQLIIREKKMEHQKKRGLSR